MSWPTESSVVHETGTYPPGDIHLTRCEVASIARTIAKYQPLHLFVRDPAFGEGRSDVPDTNLSSAKALLGGVENVTFHLTQNVYSLWARDTGPTFVKSRNGGVVENLWEEGDDPGVGFEGKSTSSGENVALLLNYNQWGRKSVPNPDMYLAATAAEKLKKPALLAPFIGEGGAVEVDGEGTMLVTESSTLNPNRNPGVSKKEIEEYFRKFLGVEKTIWIPGIRGRDVTDDHVDALARFARPGVVFVGKPFVREGDGDREEKLRNWREIREILGRERDARGRKVVVVDGSFFLPPQSLSRFVLTKVTSSPRTGSRKSVGEGICSRSRALGRLCELFGG